MKPAIYAALQLDFDYDALSARAGPQPYVLAEFWGCGAASVTQSASAPTTTQTFYALTADLDWGIELRAEALALTEKIGNSLLLPILPPRHLWFKDLAPAGPYNALAADVGGATNISAGQPNAYKMKMPQCYPYADAVEYRLTWTGGAAPIGNIAAAPAGRPPVSGSNEALCTWQAGQGTCSGDPRKDTPVNLVWPQAGNYSLTVAPLRDKHGRVFAPEKNTQLTINVRPGNVAPPPVAR